MALLHTPSPREEADADPTTALDTRPFFIETTR
jgi:hypothetical protein